MMFIKQIIKSLNSKLVKIFNQNFSPKFIRSGSCKQCGQCCRKITINYHGKFLTEKHEFEQLQLEQPRYKNFFTTGKEDGILVVTCKSLGDDNTCKSYRFRSLYCRIYPRIKTKYIAAGAQTLDGCGFYYEEK